MLKLRKLIFPIVFGISLSGYSTYALLDTFIIEEVVSDAIFDDDFFSSSSQSAISISSPSSISSSVSNSVTSNELSNVISSSEVINTSSSEEINIIDEYFTSVPVLEENSYTDQNISIHINEEIVQVKNYSGQMVDTKVYTADIRLKSIEFLRTCLAKDKYGMKIVEKTSSMAERNNAIFAFNGDYYGAQEKGYVLRNGTVFRDVRKASTIEKGDLAIYSDGSFEYFREKPDP